MSIWTSIFKIWTSILWLKHFIPTFVGVALEWIRTQFTMSFFFRQNIYHVDGWYFQFYCSKIAKYPSKKLKMVSFVYFQDVISTGYFPYAQYVRDYNPPSTPMMQPGGGPAGTPGMTPGQAGQDSPMYSTIPNKLRQPTSLLNVTDPRYSATYGNPLLRQVRMLTISEFQVF